MRADDALQAAIGHADMASQLADTNPDLAAVHAQVSQAWSAIAAEHVYVDFRDSADDLDVPSWVNHPSVVRLHPEGSA